MSAVAVFGEVGVQRDAVLGDQAQLLRERVKLQANLFEVLVDITMALT